jgi:hypothetical protein
MYLSDKKYNKQFIETSLQDISLRILTSKRSLSRPSLTRKNLNNLLLRAVKEENIIGYTIFKLNTVRLDFKFYQKPDQLDSFFESYGLEKEKI